MTYPTRERRRDEACPVCGVEPDLPCEDNNTIVDYHIIRDKTPERSRASMVQEIEERLQQFVGGSQSHRIASLIHDLCRATAVEMTRGVLAEIGKGLGREVAKHTGPGAVGLRWYNYTMTNAATNLEVAETIADQITHGTLAMFGAYDILGDASTLQFKVRGSKYANAVRVELDPSDTYTVTFHKGRGLNWKEVASISFVYASDLRTLLGARLGLAVSL